MTYPLPTTSEARRDRLIMWGQIAIVFGVWLFVLLLHADNNGLWFQGDAPRHAANGLFWQDFLRDFTLEAKTYALQYYARYPVINPAAYPPLFYLLEAGVFWVFGPSELIAKALIQMFSLIGALYTFAWLHRWISPYIAWSAALLLLTPGIVLWSHAVMLNIPSVALMVGAVYHARRWLEAAPRERRSTQLLLAAGLATLSVLTYYPAGVVFFVILVWMLGRGGWKGLSGWRTAAVAIAGIVLLVPCAVVAVRSAPTHVNWVVKSLRHAADPENWTFYGTRSPEIFSPVLLVLASAGWLVGVTSRRWRKEIWWLSIWIVVTFCAFSILRSKDGRYVLFLAPALVCLGAIALLELHRRLANLSSKSALVGIVVIFMWSGVLGWQALSVWRRPLPAVEGFHEVAAFLKEVAPAEPVFYDGYYSGVFTFRVRAADPHFERQVILGNKLLYTFMLRAGDREQEFVGSVDDVVRMLREQGGCRWLAIEFGERTGLNSAMRNLREAMRRPEFEFVRSFPVQGPKIERVDVYRMLGPIREVQKVRLPFALVSEDTYYEVEPISPRHAR